MVRKYRRDRLGRFAKKNGGAGRAVRRGALAGGATPVGLAYAAGGIGFAKGAGTVGGLAASGLVGTPLVPLGIAAGAAVGYGVHRARRRRR